MPDPPLLIAIMGPTGSGKSEIAERLAEEIDAILLNADAFQVYQGLDIGTNKPDPETRKKYQLIDLVPVDHDFGIGEWIKLALPILEEAYQNQRNVVVVGGTGFYIRALFEEFDSLMPPPDPALRLRLESQSLEKNLAELKIHSPETLDQIDTRNPIRVTRALEKALLAQEPIQIKLPPFKKLKFGLQINDDELKTKIDERIETMLKAGWIEEVKEILAQGLTFAAPGLRAIGYHQLSRFCEGKTTLEEAKTEISVLTWQYARRQKTWMKKEPGVVPIKVQPLTSQGLNSALQTVKLKTLEVLG